MEDRDGLPGLARALRRTASPFPLVGAERLSHGQVELNGGARSPFSSAAPTASGKAFVEGIGPGAGVSLPLSTGRRSTTSPRASRGMIQTAGSVVRGSFGIPPMDGPLSPWRQAIICEVHVGAATPEGTFTALQGSPRVFPRRRLHHASRSCPSPTSPGTRTGAMTVR